MRVLEPTIGMRLHHGRRWCLGVAVALTLGLSNFAPKAQGQTLQDFFANRQTITSPVGQLERNNASATVEAGEPNHGGKPGGHSLWISWVAPTNGVVRFKTEASGFDTLLSAYQSDPTNGSSFADLREVARADDSEGFGEESEIEFGVRTGERYEIAVDGYRGATGVVELQWSLEVTPLAPPAILQTPPDATVPLGDPVTLTVVLTNIPPGTKFKWFFNGEELSETTTNLVIPSMQPANVGRYKMRIEIGARYFALPTELQINTEGITTAFAQAKILDSPGTPLIGEAGAFSPRPGGLVSPRGPITPAGGSGVVRGYNGSQIFNTTFATTDPAEPLHCGATGGASYWLTYQPPAGGTLTFDTVGSSYDTVMEVYTYNTIPKNYQDLISITCDNDSAGPGGPARVQFSAVQTRQYLIVVAGVNGARGTAWLNYSLNTNQIPQPPTLSVAPQPKVVTNGSNVLLAPSVLGTPPLRFSWRKDGIPLATTNAIAVFFPSVAQTNSGNYTVAVTNDLGGLEAVLPLRVLTPTPCQLTSTGQGLALGFLTVAGQRYTIEDADFVAGPWRAWTNSFLGDGQSVVTNLPAIGTKFFRLRIE